MYGRHQLSQCGAKIGAAGGFDLFPGDDLHRWIRFRPAGSTVHRDRQA
jgi:hypothetical protein